MTDFVNKNSLVWEYKDDVKYKFDKDGNCFNTQTQKQIKRTMVGYTEGFCLNGKFKSLSQIRAKLIKIQPVTCPF